MILVSQNYLGSINHTVLSVYALKQHQIPVKGIIFNGIKDIYSEDFILQYSGLRLLGHLPEYETIDKRQLLMQAAALVGGEWSIVSEVKLTAHRSRFTIHCLCGKN